MRQWDCADCGHEDLAKPVFVDIGGRVVAFGSGCAAKALGLPVRKVVAEADKAETTARREEARLAEVMDNKLRALEAFAASSDSDPYLEAARGDYHRLGGYDRLGSFPGWLRRVSETGELGPPAGA